jgi:periplasmic mercuric ion binding protein
MRLSKWFLLPAACALTTTALALAGTTVEVKNVHLCCGACVKGVAAALKGIEGVTGTCDQKAGIVTLTADNDAAAQKGLDALTDAGYFGTTESKGLTVKPASGVPSGKVKTLSLSNAHNCCRSCNTAIKKAVSGVSGVSGDTAKPKTADFDVTGDFDASEVVKALNTAGFQVKVK